MTADPDPKELQSVTSSASILDSLAWERKVDVAVARALGWQLKPDERARGRHKRLLSGYQLYDGDGHCLGWWRDADDAWASGVLHFTSDVHTALNLAYAERITMTPDFNSEGRQVWAAAACDLHGNEHNKRWVGILKPHDWQRSASLPVAICLAVLDKYAVAVPIGRPEFTP